MCKAVNRNNFSPVSLVKFGFFVKLFYIFFKLSDFFNFTVYVFCERLLTVFKTSFKTAKTNILNFKTVALALGIPNLAEGVVTLFDHGIDSVKNVAFLCGYTDPLYFSNVFKKQIGMSPKEYKNKIEK